MQLFNADAKIFFKKFLKFVCPQKVEKKTPQKVAYLWQLGVFFSAAPTAQKSPEIHFHFINSFIQLSLVGSLLIPIGHVRESLLRFALNENSAQFMALPRNPSTQKFVLSALWSWFQKADSANFCAFSEKLNFV